MQQQPMWRREPAAPAARPQCPIHWRRPEPELPADVALRALFRAWNRGAAPVTPATSRHDAGPRAASEPETRNVIWLLDRYPQIRYFIDLHSYGETILYSWGGDQNQSVNPSMCFANRAFDGLRGRIHDDHYREYIAGADEKTAIRLGRQMSRAIALVRGRKYKVQQSVGLYPVAGSRTTTHTVATWRIPASPRWWHSRLSGAAAAARPPSTHRILRCARSCARLPQGCSNSVCKHVHDVRSAPVGR